MFNIGIIGCGWIAEKAYLPLIAKMNDVCISAVFDIDYHKAYEIQTKYRVSNIFDNINGFLSSQLDAVVITTPNNVHTYYTDMALNAGKHVLCEKPVALSKNDMESSIAAAHVNNKIFLPAFVNRFRNDVKKFNEIVTLIGEIKEIEVSWTRKTGIPRPGTWITNKPAAGGRVLIDIGTHVIDIGLMFLLDKRIHSVKLDRGVTRQAEQNGAHWNTNNDNRYLEFDVETWAKGEVSLVSGSKLKFNVDWASDINEDITIIKAVGDNGSVTINTLFGFSNNYTRENVEILYDGMPGEHKKTTFPMKNIFAIDAFNDMVRYFIDVTNGRATGILQPSDGVHVVDVIEHLYKSI